MLDGVGPKTAQALIAAFGSVDGLYEDLDRVATLDVRGAKGLGEPVLAPISPTIANAVFDAVCVRIREIPLTPERVWRALQDAG